MSQKKETKKFSETPVQIDDWEKDKLKRNSARRASTAFALRTLTEALDEAFFESWKIWDELMHKYNLDPNKEYYEYGGQIYERKRP